MIFFEAPHRILEALEDAGSVLGDNRQAAVVASSLRSLSTRSEALSRTLLIGAKSEPRGEMVLVIAGAQAEEHDYEELAKKALQLAAEGVGMKAAAAELARVTGASKERNLRARAAG